MIKLTIILSVLVFHASLVDSQGGDLLGKLAKTIDGAVSPLMSGVRKGLDGLVQTEGLSDLIQTAVGSVADILRPNRQKEDKTVSPRYAISNNIDEACLFNKNCSGAMVNCFQRIDSPCFNARNLNELEAQMDLYPDCNYSDTPLQKDQILATFFESLSYGCVGKEVIKPVNEVLSSMRNSVDKMDVSCGNSGEIKEIALMMVEELFCLFA